MCPAHAWRVFEILIFIQNLLTAWWIKHIVLWKITGLSKISIFRMCTQAWKCVAPVEKLRMSFRVVNFSKSPNLWLHNMPTLWYHVDNHALPHITDSTDSSWLNMTWHLFLYAAITYSDAQTGANLGQCVWLLFPAMLFSTNQEEGMCAEKLPFCSVKQ